MALTIRTLVRLKLYNFNACHIFYSRHLSSITKEFIKQTNPNNQDILLQNLKNSTTANNVLELVSSHHKIMNSKHLIQALRSIFTLQKCGNTDFSTKRLLKHPDFEKICNRLRSQIGTIDLNETIEALKVVSFVGVSADSTIVQVLLQLIRHNVNELSLQQIIFLNFLIKQFQSTPLIQALLIALPIVFEVQLPIKMDKNNILHISEYLHYASKCSVSENCIETLVATALRCRDEMDVKTAISIIWSICNLEPDEYFETLLNKAISVLILNIDNINYSELETTLTKLIHKHSSQYPFYFNETLADCCVNYVIDKNLGADIALYLTRKLMRVTYVNNHLLDYISDGVIKNPNLILKGDPVFPYLLVLYIATSDYKPKHWSQLKNLIEQTTIFENCNKKEILWLKLACSLLILDIHKPAILIKALDSEHLQKISPRNFLDVGNFVLIRAAISVLYPQHKDLLPSEVYLKNISISPPLDFPLEKALQKGLGSENYLKTNVKSEIGVFVDHVVALRPGGYPVAFTTKNEEVLEEINISNDSQLVLIFLLRPFHYTAVYRRMKGFTTMLLKLFEAKGYTVVPICLDEWNELGDFEKIPYLMQAIKTKTENNNVISNLIT